MSHKRTAKPYSHRFELLPGDSEQERLHEHLADLGKRGEAAAWIRKTLILGLRMQTLPEMKTALDAAKWRDNVIGGGISSTLHGRSDPQAEIDIVDDVTYEDIVE